MTFSVSRDRMEIIHTVRATEATFGYFVSLTHICIFLNAINKNLRATIAVALSFCFNHRHVMQPRNDTGVVRYNQPLKGPCKIAKPLYHQFLITSWLRSLIIVS